MPRSTSARAVNVAADLSRSHELPEPVSLVGHALFLPPNPKKRRSVGQLTLGQSGKNWSPWSRSLATV